MTSILSRIALAGMCAVVFYRAGKQERSWALLWVVLSIAASVLAVALRWEFIGLIAAQSVVVVAIVSFRSWRARWSSLASAESAGRGQPTPLDVKRTSLMDGSPDSRG